MDDLAENKSNAIQFNDFLAIQFNFRDCLTAVKMLTLASVC